MKKNTLEKSILSFALAAILAFALVPPLAVNASDEIAVTIIDH